jgi:hypothetical protein
MDGKGGATSSRRRVALLQQRLHGQDAVQLIIERLHVQRLFQVAAPARRWVGANSVGLMRGTSTHTRHTGLGIVLWYAKSSYVKPSQHFRTTNTVSAWVISWYPDCLNRNQLPDTPVFLPEAAWRQVIANSIACMYTGF